MDNFDVVVIGGGIHGAGAAQAAAAAGHSVLLLEKNDLAHGSSSRSSKLIHGGLRYLESAQFHLVHECLHERHLLTRIAPDLVHLEYFYVPIYDSTSRGSLTLRTGLSLYALLGGLHSTTLFRSLSKNQWQTLDGLKQHGLKAVFQYYDGRTDDNALTHAVMRSAIELGAESVIPAEFISAECEQDVVHLAYMENGIKKHCQTSVLINTAGAWVNTVLEKITPHCNGMSVDLVQGTHLVLDGISIEHCFYFEAPQDKRAIFMLPWKNKTLLGTTETIFTGLPDDVSPLPQEREYLLEVLQHYFPGHSPVSNPDDNNIKIVEEFAGLRVLPSGKGDEFSKPRDTVLYQSHRRVINVYGGKLTTYRLTAERIMKKIHKVLPARKVSASTRDIMLG